ncbi:ThiF family adenylyltransferase [Stratiformator vulcanicus]|uniref:Molybdopterin-synthase adenylyltransferase n=1 Tax=Stratiformator vulcanicus TaxID=2527980 RepID=A0A517QWZ7_9PLAN|nr:ThiF family adenylyltransferase [Stratiformator vulcanicus]QDT36117.1 Molybdopterin-synthase adenylyltransferase [Stratiformator vulcanicus]
MESRYAKQIRFEGIGETGQERIKNSSVTLCGCGALGTVLAESMVRAGVGELRIIDRDIVELSNLQRQVLFDERDAHEGRPKAIAASERLAAINSEVVIEPIVADLTSGNVRELVAGADLILDGTDNFETRLLINDLALEEQIPWVHAAVLGAGGQTMPIVPGETQCLRCLVPDDSSASEGETCDSVGVIGPAVGAIASLAAATALKILCGTLEPTQAMLSVIDTWQPRFHSVQIAKTQPSDCPACDQGRRDYLSGRLSNESTVLCGRNAVQIRRGSVTEVDFDRLARSLEGVCDVTRTPHFLRAAPGDPTVVVTLFRDGRAIVSGTDEPTIARTAYTRLLG